MTSDRSEYADEYQEASNFALLEESIRADERQRVLAGCWRCGASADDAIFHWNPDTGAEPAWCGECGTDGAHPFESIASALARLPALEADYAEAFAALTQVVVTRAEPAEERVMVLEEALRSIADEKLGSSPDTYAVLKGRARAALTPPVELRQHRVKDGEPIPPVEQWPPVEGE